MPYLLPQPSPAVLQGDALDDVFQACIRGITGLPTDDVRPRWQPEPGNIPDFVAPWAAFGITVTPSDKYAYKKQLSDSQQQLERDEWITLLISFYSPNAQDLAGLFVDGIQVQQNREGLAASKIKFIECQDPRQIPALFKQRWVKRVDVTARFARRVKRVYAVPAIESAGAGLDNEFYITPIIVSPPSP